MTVLNLLDEIEIVGHPYEFHERVMLKIGNANYIRCIALTKKTGLKGEKSQILTILTDDIEKSLL